jgi:hypothetical protein
MRGTISYERYLVYSLPWNNALKKVKERLCARYRAILVAGKMIVSRFGTSALRI